MLFKAQSRASMSLVSLSSPLALPAGAVGGLLHWSVVIPGTRRPRGAFQCVGLPTMMAGDLE